VITMLATAFLVMQFIISAKAGLVNAAEGVTNVRVQQQVPTGALIQTGSTGRIEVLLNPGSFFRLGENAEALLDSVELTNIAVRILSGSAIIEATTIDKDNPIRVTEEQLTVLIVAAGLYQFSNNTASVTDGELQTADGGISIKKGSQITAQGDQYSQATIPLQVTSLDLWSRQRSEQIAAATSRSAETNSASNSQTPAYQGQFLYPGATLPYGFLPNVVPTPTPFSFFQWYNGGYSFFQPLIPTPPIAIYRPFAVGHIPPITPPLPNLSHPPAPRPIAPAPHPLPSHPAGGLSHRRR
jgi:hypothetical protein